jgi:hypothetical protein
MPTGLKRYQQTRPIQKPNQADRRRIGTRQNRHKAVSSRANVTSTCNPVNDKSAPNSSIATIGLRPPPDHVGRQKGCKVRIARDPGTTVSGQASGPPSTRSWWLGQMWTTCPTSPDRSNQGGIRPLCFLSIYACLVLVTEWKWTGTRERHAACYSTNRSNWNLHLPGRRQEQTASMADPGY